jgi:multidrug efflux pump subunit AcrA (membrane-fusion protein)
MALRDLVADRKRLLVVLGALGFVLVAVAAVALRGLGAKADAEGAKPDVTVEVKTAEVEERDIAERAEGPGTVFPKDQATVSSKISAPIAQLARLEGKPVRAGQVLAVLESRDLTAAEAEATAGVSQAQASADKLASGVQPADIARAEAEAGTARAALGNAQRTYARKKALVDAGAVPQRELDDAELALRTAENQARAADESLRLLKTQVRTKDVEIARAQVGAARGRLATAAAGRSYATVVAPISGVVTEQKLYQGEMASADAPILTIVQVDEVVVRAHFPERVVGAIRVGNTAAVASADGVEGEIPGSVSLIIPAVDTSTRTVEVWIAVKNDGWRLRPGAAVRATVTTRLNRQALVIPVAAVQRDDSDPSKAQVAVVETSGEGEVAKLVDVQTGIRDGDSIEVLSGLEAGARVVVEGNYGLEDGTKVHASREGEADEGEK